MRQVGHTPEGTITGTLFLTPQLRRCAGVQEGSDLLDLVGFQLGVVAAFALKLWVHPTPHSLHPTPYSLSLYAAAEGLSGRLSHAGRRVPSGLAADAGRANAFHAR